MFVSRRIVQTYGRTREREAARGRVMVGKKWTLCNKQRNQMNNKKPIKLSCRQRNDTMLK